MEKDINELTHTIIGCAYAVSNTLGIGFLEKVYENAMVHELRKSGLSVLQQHPVEVIYDKISVGQYYADLFVEAKVLIELKTTKDLTDIHAAQCLNYLRATRLPICLPINFGHPKVQVKRIVPHDDWK